MSQTGASRNEASHDVADRRARREQLDGDLPPLEPFTLGAGPGREERRRRALPVLRAVAARLQASPGSTLTQALAEVSCGAVEAWYARLELVARLAYGEAFVDWDTFSDARERALLVQLAREHCGEPGPHLRRRGGWRVSSGVAHG